MPYLFVVFFVFISTFFVSNAQSEYCPAQARLESLTPCGADLETWTSIGSCGTLPVSAGYLCSATERCQPLDYWVCPEEDSGCYDYCENNGFCVPDASCPPIDDDDGDDEELEDECTVLDACGLDANSCTPGDICLYNNAEGRLVCSDALEGECPFTCTGIGFCGGEGSNCSSGMICGQNGVCTREPDCDPRTRPACTANCDGTCGGFTCYDGTVNPCAAGSECRLVSGLPTLVYRCFENSFTCMNEDCSLPGNEELEHCGGDYGTIPVDDYERPLFQSFSDIINPLAKLVFYIGMVLGFFTIVYSGYLLMASEGDPAKVKEAQGQLTASIFGILFLLSSATLLRLIISGFF